MAYQIIPALVALLFKLALLGYAMRSPRRHPTTRLFIALLGLFAAHNVVEIFGFIHFAKYGLDRITTLFGYSYFAVGIIFMALLFHLSLRLSIDHWGRVRPFLPLLYLPVIVLEYLLIGTDKLVAGFQLFSGFTILRVPGPLYTLFETYAILSLLASVVYLIYGARAARTPTSARLRNRWWLAALLPFVLLNVYLILANHFGLAKIPSTISIPIVLTFFLAVTTYATHQYRLFDIEFYLPWSKMRNRKTIFYRHVETTIAEIAELHSVRAVLQSLARTLRCSVALVGGARTPAISIDKDRLEFAGGARDIAAFPRDRLNIIDRIVVAQEIADAQPEIYMLMQRHHVGAIVPFQPRNGAKKSWLILGEQFSDQVYSPLDFQHVERLFDRIGDAFIDKVSTLRTQLAEATRDLRDYNSRLAGALARQAMLEQELATIRAENAALRNRNAESPHQSPALSCGAQIDEPNKTLAAQLAEYEAGLIQRTLDDCGGNRSEAARLLGLRANTLHYKLRRLGLSNNRK